MGNDKEFHKNFWDEKIRWRDNGDRTPDEEPCVRTANNGHYVIGFEDEMKGFRGFSGRLFYIQFTIGCFAGKIIKTTNLWAQGEIPLSYQKDLTPNARMLSEDWLRKIFAEAPDTKVYEFTGRREAVGKGTEELLVDMTDSVKESLR
jgi:hypothetical protein